MIYPPSDRIPSQEERKFRKKVLAGGVTFSSSKLACYVRRGLYGPRERIIRNAHTHKIAYEDDDEDGDEK